MRLTAIVSGAMNVFTQQTANRPAVADFLPKKNHKSMRQRARLRVAVLATAILGTSWFFWPQWQSPSIRTQSVCVPPPQTVDHDEVQFGGQTVSFAEVGGLNASAVEGLQLPHLPHLVETIQSHSVDGTLLFSVVFAPAGSSYWRWVKNWHLSIERSFSPAVAANRLIVGVGATTCEELARHGILGCVTDSTTQEWWPGAGGGEKDRAVRIKFSWALAALTFGYRVLYNDVDVIYTGLADPLQYLLRDQMREGALPDLQQLSDHIGHAGCEAPLAEQLMRQTLAGSWVDHTLADLAPYPLPCPSVPRFYAPGAACLSTGFWLALPTGPALRFFTLMTMTLAMERTAWEQVVFNHLLAFELATQRGRLSHPSAMRPSTLRVVSLDPRIIGNWNADKCCRSVSPANVTRVALHMGYVQGDAKEHRAVEEGLWFVKE